MTSELPISVIIAVFNAEHTIGVALESVLNQTQLPSEIIVVDDGSFDGTAIEAKKYRVRVISQSNSGPAGARNVGIQAASHEWIAFLDADDTWLPHRLAEQWRALNIFPDTTFLFGGQIRHLDGTTVEQALSMFSRYQVVRRSGTSPGADRLDNESLAQNFIEQPFINLCTVLVRRNSIIDVGLFDTTLRLSEDFDLWLRLFLHAKVCGVSKPLVNRNRYDGSISSDDNELRLSLVKVWQRIRARPHLYPSGTLHNVEKKLRVIVPEAITICLVRGQTKRAREAVRSLLCFDHSLKARALAVCVDIARTVAARSIYSFVRNVWRRYRGKPAMTFE